MLTPLSPLFQSVKPKSLIFRKGNPWLLALSDDKNVAQTGGEVLSILVLYMDDIETSWMPLVVLDDANTSNVVSGIDEANIAYLTLNVVEDFIALKIVLDSIIGIDGWVWVADGATIVCNNVWDFIHAHSSAFHSQELVFSLLSIDTLEDEPSLFIIKDAVVFASFIKGNNVHKACWESSIPPDLAVNANIALLVIENLGNLRTVHCHSESVLEDDGERNTLTELVRTL